MDGKSEDTVKRKILEYYFCLSDTFYMGEQDQDAISLVCVKFHSNFPKFCDPSGYGMIRGRFYCVLCTCERHDLRKLSAGAAGLFLCLHEVHPCFQYWSCLQTDVVEGSNNIFRYSSLFFPHLTCTETKVWISILHLIRLHLY